VSSAAYVRGTVPSSGAIGPPPATSRPAPVAPGSYLARSPAGETVRLRVAGSGEWITDLAASGRLNCRNGTTLPVSLSWPAQSVFIYAGGASATLPIAPDGLLRGGRAQLTAHFGAPASLQGRLAIKVDAVRRRLGSCTGALAFTATP
jgi:hypothetical protein